MNGLSWFAYRHPFIAALGAGLAAFGIASRRIAGESWPFTVALFMAVLTGSVILVMWWPRRGVLSRNVDAWLADDDPRVVKPDLDSGD